MRFCRRNRFFDCDVCRSVERCKADEEMALYLGTCLEEKDLHRLLLCESTGMPMLRCDDRAAVAAG